MFIWPFQGELIGAGIGALMLVITVLLSDKIGIFFTHPRGLGEKEKMMDFVKNLSFRLRLDKVGVYSTSRFPNNIYLLDNIFSRPKIIMGEELGKILSPEEIQALVYYALCRVKSKEAIFRTTSNFILTVMFLPILIFEKQSKGKGFFSTLRFFFLSPLYLARAILFRREKNLREEDEKFLQESGLRVPFASAIFKIGQLENFCDGKQIPLSFYFFENLALADHQKEQFFQNFFDWGYGPDTRYKKLVKEN